MRLLRSFLLRFAVFALLWWILSEGDVSSWLFGVPFSLFATLSSFQLMPKREWRLRPVQALRFLGFFAYQSIVGGVDVAWRAVRPSMPINPGFVTCPMRLPTESARVLLADTASLLPGTLSSGFIDDTLVLHVVDCSLPILEEVLRLEDRIAGALGLEMETTGVTTRTREGSNDA